MRLLLLQEIAPTGVITAEIDNDPTQTGDTTMAKSEPNKGGVNQHKRMAMGESVTGMKKGGKVEKMAEGGCMKKGGKVKKGK
jgi:hypothetical protein